MSTNLPKKSAFERHAEYFIELANAEHTGGKEFRRALPQIRRAIPRLLSSNKQLLLDMVWAVRVFIKWHVTGSERIAWLELALGAARDLHNTEMERRFLDALGAANHDLGNTDLALQHFKAALSLQNGTDDPLGQSSTLNNIGLLDAGQTRHELATSHIEQAPDLSEQASDLSEQADAAVAEALALAKIAASSDSTGDAAALRESFERAHKFNSQLTSMAEEQQAITLADMGMQETNLSNYAQAWDYLMSALTWYKKLYDRQNIAAVLTNLGRIAARNERLHQAQYFYKHALALHEIVRNPAKRASTLEALGQLFYRRYNMENALACFKLALELQERIADKRDMALTLTGLGEVYTATEQYELAEQHHSRALALHREVGNKSGEATTLNDMGILYITMTRLQDAVECFKQALPLWQAVQDRASEYRTLHYLGAAQMELGQHSDAGSVFERAAELAHNFDNLP